MPNRFQEEQDKLAFADAWHANQRAALALKKRQDELIAQAREGLRRALREDQANGLAETAALRNARPQRPAILDVTLEWDASPERRAKFETEKARQLDFYYTHLVAVDPSLMSAQDKAALPAAILHCQRQVQAAEQAAQEGK